MPRLNLNAKINLDSTGFQAGMRKAQSSASAGASQIKSALAGAFAATALVAAGKRVVEYGSRISDLAVRFNVAATDLQNLDLAAQKSGSSLEDIVKSLRALSRAKLDALEGGAEADELLEFFRAVGVSADDLRSKNLVQLFKQIGTAVKGAGTGGEAEGVLSRLLGRSAGDLITLFNEGLVESISAFEDMGIALEDDVIDQLDTISDQIGIITAQMRGPLAEAVLIASKGVQAMSRGLRFAVAALKDLSPVRFKGGDKPGEATSRLLDEIHRETVQEQIALEKAEDAREMRRGGLAVGSDMDAGFRRLLERGTSTQRTRLLERLNKQEFNKLTNEGKLLNLQQSQLRISREMAQLEQDSIASLEKQVELNSVNEQIKALSKVGAASGAKQSSSFSPAGDALSRIGGVFASGRRHETVQRDQLERLSSIDRRLATGVKIEDI